MIDIRELKRINLLGHRPDVAGCSLMQKRRTRRREGLGGVRAAAVGCAQGAFCHRSLEAQGLTDYFVFLLELT